MLTTPMPTDQGGPTVLGSWTATVVRALDRMGVDGSGLAREVGIDLRILDDASLRVPLRVSTQLWRAAVDRTGDPCLGLDVARHARPGTFHGLGVGVVTSGSFRDALERVVRFGRVVCSPNGAATLTEDAETITWEVRWPPGVERPCDESIEAVLACVVRAGRFLVGHDLALAGVSLVRPERPSASRFEEFFAAPVRYGAEAYGLTFPLRSVERRLPTACEAAAEGADVAVRTYLDRSAPDGVTDRARAAVAGRIGSREVTAPVVAADLAMSPRTLQRRLHEEGTTLRDVVTEVRLARAKEEISVGDRSVESIADALGFSDAAAFRRAFKRATGMTPQAFRHQAAGGPPPEP